MYLTFALSVPLMFEMASFALLAAKLAQPQQHLWRAGNELHLTNDLVPILADRKFDLRWYRERPGWMLVRRANFEPFDPSIEPTSADHSRCRKGQGHFNWPAGAAPISENGAAPLNLTE